MQRSADKLPLLLSFFRITGGHFKSELDGRKVFPLQANGLRAPQLITSEEPVL